MLTIEQALEIIARLGGDTPPSSEELTGARDAIARELHALKGASNVDLEAVVSLRETYAVVADAITEAEAAEEEAAKEVDDLLDGIPDPDAAAVEPEAVSASGKQVLGVREAVARLGLGPTVQVVSEPEPDASKVKHTVRLGSEVRDDATWADMAEAFVEAGRSLKAGKDRIVRITSEFDASRTLPGTIEGNTRLIDSFTSPEAVAAAGGCCSLATPIYENPVYGSTARPIRDSLTTYGADRGEVTLYPAVCIPQAGSAVWTCEDDAAVDPEDPDTWKECAEVDCEDAINEGVDAIYKCITIGNYQSRFSPEQWQAHLQALAISHARLQEVHLFSKMRAGVTSTHTGLATGSTYLNVVNTAIRATSLMRQDQRLADVQFHLTLADWVKGAIAEGFGINRLDKGGALDDVEVLVREALAREGINVTYSLDIDDLEAFQYDGALAEYPDTASSVLYPEGYFTFLDGGQFDLGTEIRDHELNRQNKIAAFAESYEGLLARGCNAKALDIPIECDLSVACPS